MEQSRRLDTVLRASIGVLIAVILGLGTWFGYSVYADRKIAEQSTPALRLAGSLKKQVSRSPNDAALRIRLGEAYAAGGQIQKAIEQLNAALKIQPNHTGALSDLGYIAATQGRVTEARAYYKKVLDLTADSTMAEVSDRRERAYYQLGLIEYNEGNYDVAIGNFKQSLRIRDDASDTYFYLAHALDEVGQREEAMRNLGIAIRFDPNFSQALYLLGKLYLEQGDRTNASYYAGRSAQLSPTAPEPEALVAQIGDPAQLLEQAKGESKGDLDKAIEDATVAANLEPTNIEAAKLKADLLLKAGNDKAALEAYKAASELDPEDSGVELAIKKLSKP